MSENILEFTNLQKSFGQTKVLNGISLSVAKGEFITFLGPSGCGKTTMLRVIAGLESPEGGSVFLNGEDITHKEPNRRNVNTIFQNYALFPHMNIFQNIAYSLKLKKVPKDEIKARVAEMLELVQLTGFEKRMPSELSGGQKQRVAIARALINNPSVLLLDEPLGALDLQLRRQMQTELKRLQKQLGITFIYITHDQEEAINMSDRIVVMQNGRFEQIGSPEEVYDHPRTSFVAQFVGTSNLLKGTVRTVLENNAVVEFGSETALIDNMGAELKERQEIVLSIRGENLTFSKTPLEASTIHAKVVESSYVAGQLKITFQLPDGQEFVSSRHGVHTDVVAGDQVFLYWTSAQLVDLEG